MKYRIKELYKQTNENTEHRSTTNKQMKYRIQELYKQSNEIPNTGALQTNR
jgi:hypothetical protein